MKKIVLYNGVEMPILGFGVYQIADAEECERSVCEALSRLSADRYCGRL